MTTKNNDIVISEETKRILANREREKRIVKATVLRIINDIAKKCEINDYTHLCARSFPKDDEDFIAQLKGAQGNVLHDIKRQVEKI